MASHNAQEGEYLPAGFETEYAGKIPPTPEYLHIWYRRFAGATDPYAEVLESYLEGLDDRLPVFVAGNRSQARSHHPIQRAVNQIIPIYARAAVESNQPLTEGELYSLARPDFRQGPEVDEIIRNLVPGILQHAQLYCRLRSATHAVIPSLQQDLIDNPGMQYSLFKFLISPYELSPSIDGKRASALKTFLFYDDHQSKAGISGSLQENLGLGAYDRFIATDLLGLAETQALTPQLRRMGPFWEFMKQVNPDLDISLLAERITSQPTAQWPSELAQSVAHLKQQFKRAYDTVRYGYRTDMEKYSLLPSTQTAESERQALIAKLTGMGIVANGIPLFVRDQQQQFRSNKRRQILASPPPPTDIYPGETELPLAPRQLYYLYDAAAAGPDIASHLGRKAEEFLATYRGDSALEQVVQKILERLPQLDFTQGNIPGVKPYHEHISINDRPFAMYGFKPKEAFNLSGSSPLTEGIRVLFTFDKTTLYFITIGMRKETDRVRKNLKNRHFYVVNTAA